MTQHQRSSAPASANKRALRQLRERYHVSLPAAKTGVPPKSPSTPSGGGSLPPHPPASRRLPRRAASRRGHSRWGRKVFLFLIIICVLSGGIFGYKILAASNKISVAERSIFGQLKDLLFNSDKSLTGEGDDRINILLLAVGGEGHKGENLADTIIIVSLKPQENKAALLSIPRDLYVQVPENEYFTKINAVHAYGEGERAGQGPERMREVVEEITGQTMHYFARVDFLAFKHVVDAVGGVNITIENSFFDYWHKISFPAGTEKMNGERALAYVRARYIEGGEGGDFKRAARQQQVLLGLRDKVFSVQTAFDFSAMNQILNSLSDNIRTDLELWEMKRLFELARLIDNSQVHSQVLTTGHNGVLVGGTEILSGAPASVLRPRTGDYSEIRSVAADIFNSEATNATASADGEAPPPEEPVETSSPTPAAEPKLEIRNGTNITGLASKTGQKLEGDGYEVVTVGNAADRATAKTTVYILDSDFVEAGKALAESLSAASDSGLPSNEPASEADVLIILGQDAQE